VSRRHQIQRQWEIVRYLEAGGALTLADLAQLIRIPEDQNDQADEPGRVKGAPKQWSQGTLRRDLEDLIEVGFPILKQNQGGVRWRFPEGFRNTIPGPFPFSELMALYYARKVFDAFRETPFRQTFQSLLITLEKLLPAPTRAFLDHIDHHFGPYLPAVKSLSIHHQILEEAGKAADDRRCVEILTLPRGRQRVSWFRFDPYGIWFHMGQTMLMGYLHETKSLELLPLESIREIRPTRDYFQLPLEIDFHSILVGTSSDLSAETAFGDPVVLRCVGGAVNRVREAVDHGWLQGATIDGAEETRTASLEMSNRGDGVSQGEKAEVIVRFKASDMKSVRFWILSLGRGAEVLSPMELRRAVATELRSAQVPYEVELPADNLPGD
jgi:predicted DNA-binding transcriptional regulator YafY